MDATERMALCAELDLDLDWTMAVLRSFHFSSAEISEAFDSMPDSVVRRWGETLRLIPIPKTKKK